MQKVVAERNISTIPGQITPAVSNEDICLDNSKPFTALVALKAELIIATNMKCRISLVDDLKKIAVLLKEENFGSRWECQVCCTLDSFDMFFRNLKIGSKFGLT